VVVAAVGWIVIVIIVLAVIGLIAVLRTVLGRR
jgi:hypothetical protein